MSTRELILGTLAIIFLILASTFIGLYAAAKSHLNKDHKHHDGPPNDEVSKAAEAFPRFLANSTVSLQHPRLRRRRCLHHPGYEHFGRPLR